jgi:hypothetical protein
VVVAACDHIQTRDGRGAESQDARSALIGLLRTRRNTVHALANQSTRYRIG